MLLRFVMIFMISSLSTSVTFSKEIKNYIFIKCSCANGTILETGPKHLFISLYLYTSLFIDYRESRAGLILPLPGAIHFHFSWLSVFWRQTITWHTTASAVVEWLPHGLNVPLHPKSQLFPHTVLYWSCGFCGYVKGMRLLFVSFAAFFLFLSRSIQFEILMSVSWNFKGIDIWFSVHCLQSRESRAHFLPSSRLLDLEKIAVLSGVVFSFVTAALKSRWSHSTGVQITQQQALKNKTAGDFCAV